MEFKNQLKTVLKFFKIGFHLSKKLCGIHMKINYLVNMQKVKKETPYFKEVLTCLFKPGPTQAKAFPWLHIQGSQSYWQMQWSRNLTTWPVSGEWWQSVRDEPIFRFFGDCQVHCWLPSHHNQWSLSNSYLSACLVWVALSGDNAPNSIAFEVIRTHKPPVIIKK